MQCVYYLQKYAFAMDVSLFLIRCYKTHTHLHTHAGWCHLYKYDYVGAEMSPDLMQTSVFIVSVTPNFAI